MSTRDRILDGAAQVMRTHGLANATTKKIARAAGLSEAMLYKVFQDKSDLFLGVLIERLPRITMLTEECGGTAGRDNSVAGVRKLVAEVLAFYLESFPIAVSVFSDPDLLTRHRQAMQERGVGPHRVVEGVAAYLSGQQQTGRLPGTMQPEVLAELLVGACLHRAFLSHFEDRTMSAEDVTNFAARTVAAIAPALAADR